MSSSIDRAMARIEAAKRRRRAKARPQVTPPKTRPPERDQRPGGNHEPVSSLADESNAVTQSISPKADTATVPALAYGGLAAPIHVAMFRGARNAWPEQCDDIASFGEFAEDLAGLLDVEPKRLEAKPGESTRDHARRLKEGLLYFGPYRLKPDAPRCDANVTELTLLVSDLDRCDAFVVYERLEALGLGAFIYASPSDDASGPDDARRVRVVCPVSRPIKPGECAHTRLAFAEALGLAPGCGADGVLSPQIGFFVGRLPDAPARESWRLEGAPVDVDALMSRALKHAWSKRSEVQGAERPAVDKSPMPAIGELDQKDETVLRALLELHAEPGQDTNRRQRLRATGGYLARQGFSDERIAAIVSRIPLLRAPEAAVKLAVQCARQYRSGDPKAAGWNLLAELDASAAAQLEAVTTPEWLKRHRERRAARAAKAEALEVKPANSNANAPATPEPPSDDELWARLGVVVDLSTPPKPLKYICEGLGLAAGKMSMVTGYAGTSKGLVIALLALCVASGKPFLGHDVVRTRVGLADFETGDLTTQRLHRIANSLGVDLDALKRERWFALIKASKVDHSWLDTVRELARRGAIGALFGDSYSSIVSSTGIAVDENEARFGELGWDFGRISNETDLCITLTGHEKKRTNGKRGGSNLEMISGTNALARTCQAVISVVRPNDDKPTHLELRCARHPEDGFQPIGLRWVDEPMPAERPTPGWLLKHAKWGLRAELVVIEPKVKTGAARGESEGGLLSDYRTHRQVLAFLADGEQRTITNMVDSDEVTGRRNKIADAVAELVEAGLVKRSEPSATTMQGQPIYHYSLAPSSPKAAEVRAKWTAMGRLAPV